MFKLKQMVMMTLIGSAVLCSTTVIGAKLSPTSYLIPKCNGYWLDKKCQPCPAHAKCGAAQNYNSDLAQIPQCYSGYVLAVEEDKKLECLELDDVWPLLKAPCKRNWYPTVRKKKPTVFLRNMVGAWVAAAMPNEDFDAEELCTACPANGVCDGKTAICVDGYKPVRNKNTWEVTCQPLNCKSNQWAELATCKECPANATCNGIKFTCKSGYTQTANSCTKDTSNNTKKCTQESHESYTWIKEHYKNCTNCKMKAIKAGACNKNKKAHKHYSCECSC